MFYKLGSFQIATETEILQAVSEATFCFWNYTRLFIARIISPQIAHFVANERKIFGKAGT